MSKKQKKAPKKAEIVFLNAQKSETENTDNTDSKENTMKTATTKTSAPKTSKKTTAKKASKKTAAKKAQAQEEKGIFSRIWSTISNTAKVVKDAVGHFVTNSKVHTVNGFNKGINAVYDSEKGTSPIMNGLVSYGQIAVYLLLALIGIPTFIVVETLALALWIIKLPVKGVKFLYGYVAAKVAARKAAKNSQ
jgi:hypothetical protein